MPRCIPSGVTPIFGAGGIEPGGSIWGPTIGPFNASRGEVGFGTFFKAFLSKLFLAAVLALDALDLGFGICLTFLSLNT